MASKLIAKMISQFCYVRISVHRTPSVLVLCCSAAEIGSDDGILIPDGIQEGEVGVFLLLGLILI